MKQTCLANLESRGLTELVREVAKGDEIKIDGRTWRITQVLDGPDGRVNYAYAGPVNDKTGKVEYDRAVIDLRAWQREYARQH